MCESKRPVRQITDAQTRPTVPAGFWQCCCTAIGTFFSWVIMKKQSLNTTFCVKLMVHISQGWPTPITQKWFLIAQYRASVRWLTQTTQGDAKHWNNAPAITAFSHQQIAIRQWEEKWRHFNVRFRSNWLKSSDGDAHKSSKASKLFWSRLQMFLQNNLYKKYKSWGATKHTEGFDCYA